MPTGMKFTAKEHATATARFAISRLLDSLIPEVNETNVMSPPMGFTMVNMDTRE
jgi:hypothetical protein